MRVLSFVLIVFFFIFPASWAHAADYSNDSDSININYTGAAPVLPSSENGTGGTNSGGSGSSTGGSGSSSDPSGGSGGSTPDVSGSTDTTVPVIIVTGGNNSGNTGGQGAGSAGAGTLSGGGSSGSVSDAADILNTLQGNQAVTFGGGGVSGNGGGGGGANSFGTITLSGKKVRAAFDSRGISEILLGTSLGRGFLTKGDAAVAAASILLQNKDLEEVVLSLSTINLTYTASGRLFAVFPIDYPLKVSVNPKGETPEARVQIQFPWYSFFLQTYVSKKALAGFVDGAVTAFVAENASDGVDAQTRLLTAVTETLESHLVR